MSYVHAIVGPTGVGKTALATRLARETNAPTVVADRIQCFTDLSTTSARSDCDSSESIIRLYLADRVVADGDYPAEEAAQELVRKLERLTMEYPYVVVEGGSISVLRRLAARRGQLSFNLSAQVLHIPDDVEYRLRLFTRARGMLSPNTGGPSMLDELAMAWKNESQREFVASINGFEAALEWCCHNRVDPATLSGNDMDPVLLDEIAWMVADAHAVHGREQDETFSAIFESTPVSSLRELGCRS